MRQCTAWENSGVIVVPRPLRYPRGWPNDPAKQKGVDVALAIDFVVFAIEQKMDVGIVASSDTDMRPALEYVLSNGKAIAELIAWKRQPKLSIVGYHLWCHMLGWDDYEAVSDTRDYNIKN